MLYRILWFFDRKDFLFDKNYAFKNRISNIENC